LALFSSTERKRERRADSEKHKSRIGERQISGHTETGRHLEKERSRGEK